MCGLELIEYGAILLGPPDAGERVLKQHLCTDCYATVQRVVDGAELDGGTNA